MRIESNVSGISTGNFSAPIWCKFINQDFWLKCRVYRSFSSLLRFEFHGFRWKNWKYPSEICHQLPKQIHDWSGWHRGNIRQTFMGRSSQVQATGRKEEQASHRTFHIKTQLTLRLFNSVVHFSTCITSWKFLNSRAYLYIFNLYVNPNIFSFCR